MSNIFHPCGAAAHDLDSVASCVTALDDPHDDGNYWVVCETHDHLIRTAEVRKATVKADSVGWGSDPLKVVNAYLPHSYQASQDGDVITIVGTDDAGWTLDGYVIPRLNSDMIYPTEVK